MKTRFLLFAATLCCIFLTPKMDAQVSSVNYRLKYNPDSCHYEAYVVINSGTATTAAQRTQFNSQFTIVVPQGDSIVSDNIRSYAPYQDNSVAGSGTTPMQWSITTKLRAPNASPGNRFYSITPNLSPASRYGTALKPTLQPGDEILLFTFKVSSISTCGSGIRIWENGSDPDSGQDGMLDSDFNNGFTLGGINQLYNANSTQLHPPAPVLLSVTSTCAAGIEIDLTDSTRTCQLPLTYSWAGPGGYTTNTQDVSRPTATVADQGTYTVTVTDAYGCTATTSVVTSSKPSAGADQTTCAGSTVTISGTQPTSGTWAAQTGNPTGATLSPIGGGQATVTFTNAAQGIYRFIYSTTSCSDTMAVTVSRKAVVSATSSLICVGATTTLNSDSTGVWSSSNIAIASVLGNTVTGVSQGSVTFTLTQASGCTSTTSPIVVNPRPTVSITGTPAVCIGATTTLSPTTGGTWASSNGLIATVSNAGVVSGVAAGTAKFAFTETATGCISDSLTITVTTQPTAGIDPSGNDSICVLTSTQLTPNTGGTWLSSNPAVATVSNSGLVTGLTAGSAKFVWTQTSSGCKSDSVGPVIVIARPSVTASPPTICVGSTTTLSPTTGGTWASANASIATVTNGGVVTGVAQGTTNFTFTETASGCSNTTGNINVNPRPTVLANASTICVGATTTLSPSTGGTWVSLESDTASVTSSGLVTGLIAGNAIMRFTETSSGCTNTITITVEARPTATLNSPAAICPGFTTTVTVSPAQAGSWASSNFSIATVSNAGLVTGIAVGTSTFTFTSSVSGCVSVPTSPVTINSKPTVSITGSNQICIGTTTTLAASPVGPGTWTALNPLVASINSSTGVVTAVGPGSAQFTFTDATGCVSDASSPVTVNVPATASFTGPSTICAGFTTQLSPTSGGTWVSSNPLIATVNNAGLVSGISSGTVKFVFNNTATGCNSDSLTGTINPQWVVGLDGSGPICIDSSIETTKTDTIPGGVWVSSNTSIATINATTGVITGVSQGTAIFTYTSAAGCASAPIISLAIMPRPTVNITGPTAICIGDSTTLSPNSGGTWTSSVDSIATVNPTTGVVTGLREGSVTFTFTSADGCVSLPSAPVTINPKPIVVVNGPSSICVGATSNATPAINGTWTSSDNAVATISNGGLITGIATGSATFRYTQSSTGCISDPSTSVAVTPGPTVSVPDSFLCLGEQTTLVPSPVTAGTWTSSNSSVATISGAGVVTAIAQGTATFTFRDNSGCSSQPSAVVTVNGRPSVGITGSSSICIGGTTNLSPTTGGTWVSSNASIASVTNAGLVTGVAAGSATFTFTLAATGCVSLPTNPVTVTPAPVVSFSGPTALCVGGTTQVSSGGAGGVWTSSNPSVASVNPTTGVVTALAPGTASFTFVETATGCASAASTGNVTITHCFNPDFNATFVNVQVAGDVSTNDYVDPTLTSYGPTPTILEISKPSGGVYTLTINSDGSYTFIADKEGVYRFEVPVCISPQVSGCPRSDLTITVRNNISTAPLPVANVDIASTPISTPVTLATLSNDRCVQITGCSLDPSTVTITDNPSNGGAVVQPNGDIIYTPTVGFVGIDTLTYQVCVTGGSPCATAKQIITVNAATAGNSTIAADDFAVTPQNTAVSGNVQTNDSDPEGNTQTITIQNTTETGKGTLVLASNGAYTFTPVNGFSGPVEFIYQTIDNHASPDTAYATLHILVMQDLTLKVRVYLEGALLNNANALAGGRPLMRDNLRTSIFAGQLGVRYIPNADPYQFVHGTVNVLSKFDHVAPGDRGEFDTIPSPSTVFAVTGQDAIVDWVFIELRSKTSNTTVLSTRSGLLQRDGDVVDLDGVSGLRFPGIVMDDYYVVVRHHSHLGAMTAAAQTPLQLTTLVNFTSTSTANWDYGTSNPNSVSGGINYTGLAQQNVVKSGITYRALWAGDFDANGKIKNDGSDSDINPLYSNVLSYAPPANITYYPYTGSTPTTTPSNEGFTSNFDFGYGYLQGDFDMNGKAKFDNPNDDKNMLYGQLLFYVLNTSLLSNFDHFIEQLP